MHQIVHDWHLAQRGLRNCWGYNSIGSFAPRNEYASGGQNGRQVQEFKQMAKALHESGIEVILDVVYNHTAEGDHLGPTLSFRGIDNAAYYRLLPDQPLCYLDYTGTGNSLNMRHSHMLHLIKDSLRYWVQEMHVDGFRFDLAATLARGLPRGRPSLGVFRPDPPGPRREPGQADRRAVGPRRGGYQVGNFPTLWSEWNGMDRDAVRDYWRGADEALAEFAYRFTGSPDLYAANGRKPYVSINFATAHDGFTLRDLVSCNEKRIEANGEDNRDSESHNRSWNCGVEGETDDPEVLALRRRQPRNFLATLMLSQGVPMLLGGDEIGRSQRGNNNAYGQNNELSWFDREQEDHSLLEFTCEVIGLRHEHPIFRRRPWFLGRAIRGAGVVDVEWFSPPGGVMSEEDWAAGFGKSLAVFINGQAIAAPDARGQRVVDESFLVLFNAHFGPREFRIPKRGTCWELVVHTARESSPASAGLALEPGAQLAVEARSLVLLKERPRESAAASAGSAGA